eukprot:297853-Amphidinium_carterae.1
MRLHRGWAHTLQGGGHQDGFRQFLLNPVRVLLALVSAALLLPLLYSRTKGGDVVDLTRVKDGAQHD